MTDRPWHWRAGTTHEASARPSTKTVQQPHAPCGAHPFFGEMRQASPRSTVINDTSSSMDAVNGAPLSVKLTVAEA